MKNNHIITVDGPSASGKGSLAKALAKELNFILLDSGLLYRAYSYCFEKSHNHSAAKSLFLNLRINSIEHEMHVFEENRDITSILRHENVAKLASKLSGLKETRDNFDPDVVVWMDTIKEGRYEDTNKMFEEPDNVNFHITEMNDENHKNISTELLKDV